MAKSRQPETPLSPSLPLRRRVVEFAPGWSWLAAAIVAATIMFPFLMHSVPAPYYRIHGDRYRGWPLIYGLDQGDVYGDEFGPFVTYLHVDRLALDTMLAMACGLPPAAWVVWAARRRRRPIGERAEPIAEPDSGA